MNASEMQRALAGVLGNKAIFLGCYFEDELFDAIQSTKQYVKPCIMIINTLRSNDTSHKIGHWFMIYMNHATSTLGYYDSYNLQPMLNSSTLYKFIQANPSMNVSTLAYRLQGLKSLVCGVYSMYFCYVFSLRNHKYAVQCINKKFKRNEFYHNDKLIYRLGHKLFLMPRCERRYCNHDDTCILCNLVEVGTCNG